MPKIKEKTIVAGTRGSSLALAQTGLVIKLIQRKNKRFSFDTKIVKTSGDNLQRRRNSTLTGKDSFTREIDLALMRKEIDFAVHSLKDVPIEDTLGSKEPKLEIAAYPKRESPYDVLISRNRESTLQTLPENARVGTSSLRRGIQLKLLRPDIEIVAIRGNVPTRIKKMRESESNLDAIVLAQAGLRRLNISDEANEVIPSDVILPAIGQGCLAVSVRSNDYRTKQIVKSIDDRRTRLCVSAERAFSKELGGGCNTPIAALATMKGSKIKLRGLIVGETSSTSAKSNFVIRDEIEGKAEEGENLGRKLARTLKAMSM